MTYSVKVARRALVLGMPHLILFRRHTLRYP
jgi:hypothetical protein